MSDANKLFNRWTREGCNYLAPDNRECLGCGHVHTPPPAPNPSPLDALVASARNPTKAYTATVAPKPDDAVARARELAERILAGGEIRYAAEEISHALRAERMRALEDVEMAVAGYVAVAAGPKHVEGVRKLIRALKEKP